MLMRVIVFAVYIRLLDLRALGHAEEFCLMDTFNATCRSEAEVVVIDSASYGRMKVGRCVTGNFGYLGCSVDVLPVLDRKCSGRRSCEMKLPDPELFKTRPCPGDFTSYLEVTYHCQTVETVERVRCKDGRPPVLTRSTGCLASVVAEETGYGSYACPWIIRAYPGQRINVTLHNFFGGGDGFVVPSNGGRGSGSGSSAVLTDQAKTTTTTTAPGDDHQRIGSVCFEVAALFDSMEQKLVTVCSGDGRQVTVLLSKTNTVRVEFLVSDVLRSLGAFLLEYTVFGCSNNHHPSPSSASSSSSFLSPGSSMSSSSSEAEAKVGATNVVGREAMWFRRSGETLVVGCNYSSAVWYLVCKDRMWHGDIGNCSQMIDSGWRLGRIFVADEAFPIGILVIVMIGVATGIVIGGFILCLINIVTKRNYRHREILSTAKNTKYLLGPPSQMLSERSPFLNAHRPTLDAIVANSWPCAHPPPHTPHPPQSVVISDVFPSSDTAAYCDRSLQGLGFCASHHDDGSLLDLGNVEYGTYPTAMDAAAVADDGSKARNGRLVCRASFSKSLRSDYQPRAARTHVYDYPQFATHLV